MRANMKGYHDLDEAFVHRLHHIVDFPKPRSKNRRRIWEDMFTPKTRSLILFLVACVAAGAIVLLVRRCCQPDATGLDQDDVVEAAEQKLPA